MPQLNRVLSRSFIKGIELSAVAIALISPGRHGVPNDLAFSSGQFSLTKSGPGGLMLVRRWKRRSVESVNGINWSLLRILCLYARVVLAIRGC